MKILINYIIIKNFLEYKYIDSLNKTDYDYYLWFLISIKELFTIFLNVLIIFIMFLTKLYCKNEVNQIKTNTEMIIYNVIML